MINSFRSLENSPPLAGSIARGDRGLAVAGMTHRKPNNRRPGQGGIEIWGAVKGGEQGSHPPREALLNLGKNEGKFLL
jgi:hypothetical protein